DDAVLLIDARDWLVVAGYATDAPIFSSSLLAVSAATWKQSSADMSAKLSLALPLGPVAMTALERRRCGSRLNGPDQPRLSASARISGTKPAPVPTGTWVLVLSLSLRWNASVTSRSLSQFS